MIQPATSWQHAGDRLLAACAGTGAAGASFFLSSSRDQRFELTAGLDRNELAVLVDDEHAGNRVDSPGLGEFAFPALALIILRPGDFVVFDELLELVEPACSLGWSRLTPMNSTPLS